MHSNFKELCRNTPQWCTQMQLRMLKRQRQQRLQRKRQQQQRGVAEQMRSRRHLSNTVWQRMATMQKMQRFVQRNIRTMNQLRQLRRSKRDTTNKIYK